jgi:hypothetical protein
MASFSTAMVLKYPSVVEKLDLEARGWVAAGIYSATGCFTEEKTSKSGSCPSTHFLRF